ncbi:hypothetical protein [Sulfurimonas sp.]|uniref:hypothetical protein n=1 Tax=Sulfurimonas sp. TaxID=2022749 RepID=UPI0025D38406|nr:hypothetical protein [Sulfurimonas sp.]
MQRKNYILKANFKSKRAGIAMIMAIIVVVVISTIMVLSLSLTSQTNKKTADLYLYEQAVLYSRSTAELTLLRIADGGCTQGNINTTTDDGIYDINVTTRYIFTNPVAGCDMYINDINTTEQNGSVLMDITISVPTDRNLSTEPITYFRRTIQKL